MPVGVGYKRPWIDQWRPGPYNLGFGVEVGGGGGGQGRGAAWHVYSAGCESMQMLSLYLLTMLLLLQKGGAESKETPPDCKQQ